MGKLLKSEFQILKSIKVIPQKWQILKFFEDSWLVIFLHRVDSKQYQIRFHQIGNRFGQAQKNLLAGYSKNAIFYLAIKNLKK